MKTLIKMVILSFIVSFAFVGCTGKVQTNPIPEDRKFSLPENIKNYKKEINQNQITDFRVYVNHKLKVERFNVIEANQKTQLNTNDESTFWNSGYRSVK